MFVCANMKFFSAITIPSLIEAWNCSIGTHKFLLMWTDIFLFEMYDFVQYKHMSVHY